MRVVSTNTARAVFGNLRFTCPHCGKKLKLKRICVLGSEFDVPCYGSCGCSAAKDDMEHTDDPSRRYSAAGIPERYLSVQQQTGGSEDRVANGMSLFVHGPNGTAKSTFAASVAKALLDMGLTVRWENSRRFMSELQGMYDGRKSDALERAYACRVLVLDDLGKEQPTPYSISMLYELVEMRYGDMKPIVATSNFDRAQLAERWSQADQSTAEAIVSRLCDECESVEMGGGDLRL